MILYDGKASITWHGGEKLTPAKMKKDPRYSRLFDEPCVLFDDGCGVVYSFRSLAELLAEYGSASFDELPEAIAASWAIDQQPTLAELQQQLDEATDALVELASLLGGE